MKLSQGVLEMLYYKNISYKKIDFLKNVNRGISLKHSGGFTVRIADDPLIGIGTSVRPAGFGTKNEVLCISIAAWRRK